MNSNLSFGASKLGDLGDEQEVFQWILTQKNDESIEEVDRETFLEYITTKDFLAVVFCKFIHRSFNRKNTKIQKTA